MIIISPWSRPLTDGKLNPKCPKEDWWRKLVSLINEPVIQVGSLGELHVVPSENVRHSLSLHDLGLLVDQCRTFVSVDSLFQHFAWDRSKYGIVIFGQSNPKIFGHPENINLLKGEEYLMSDQFLFWNQVPYRDDVFVEPEEVVKYL